MIPVLYNHSEKNFTSNGLGRLTECTSCIVTEERNGVFECEFTYPISGRHFNEIAEGCIIFVTHDHSGVPQPFDIYKRSVPINGEVTFSAAHVSYRLGKTVLMPYTATSCATALSGIKTHCVPDCEFSFYTDKSVTTNFKLTTPTAAKSILCGTEGSILDVYGTGEYKYDKFNVLLYLHRGTDTDVQIRYGKNLVDMTDEIDSSGSYSAVVPFWQNVETGAVKMLPERVVIAEDAPIYLDYWTDENGRRISDENGAEFEFAVSNIVAATLDLSADFETEPTDAQMRQKAQESANANKLYTQSLSVDFVQLAQSEEYKDLAPLQELNLCDTCEVIYNNRPVRVKVIKTEYDVLADRYSEIELGDPPANYADVLMGEVVNTVPTRTEVTSAIKSASDLIRGVNGGNVVFRYQNGKPYEILVMDTEDIETAVHVLRINMNGIGFSHTGVDGVYTTAWTLNGHFLADFIESGTLHAADGKSYWDLNNSKFVNYGTGDESSRLEITTGRMNFWGAIDGDEELSGSICPIKENGNIVGTGIVAEPGNALELGYRQEGSTAYTRALTINNGLNTGGFTEHIILRTATRLRGRLIIGSTVDQDQSCYLGEGTVNGWDGERFLRVNSPNGTTFQTSGGYSLFPSGGRGFCLVSYDDAYIRTTLSAQTVTQRSDENLKNIWPYETAYDDVLDELEPISFTWKEDDTSQHVGLGARRTRQLLEEHGIDNAGFVVDRNDIYSINYSELSVMLLKRVQDQTKQIKDLSERLERLEALLANS